MKLVEENENFLKQDTKFESSGGVRKEYHFLQVEKVRLLIGKVKRKR